MSTWRRLPPLGDLSRSARQFRVLLLVLLMVMLVAVGFYSNIESRLSREHWSFIDAAYMAVLTITTIGFMEVHPLSQAGKLFTTGFAVTGLVLLALAARSAASFLVGQQLSERVQLRRRLRALRETTDHYIVCGYGRMGRETVHQLRRRGLPTVVIEQDPAALELLRETDIPFVEGNATEDEQLRNAGVERARCLIAAVGTDEDNLFVVLSARLLSPKLHIVARAGREETVDKLLRAGADSVHSPYIGGGRDLAFAAIDPSVVHFLEEVLHREDLDVDIFAVSVPEGSPVMGKPMLGSGVMQEGGAMILGVMNAGGGLHTNPRPQTAVSPGDTLIAMGTREQVAKLERAVKG
ncbi:MAG: NAD-binding protein [Armatimonadota bacterium]|nr:MAG: NAD-binding protein [Armatimonadota bacterium]